MSDTKSLKISLSTELRSKLDVLKLKTGRTISDIVAGLVEEMFENPDAEVEAPTTRLDGFMQLTGRLEVQVPAGDRFHVEVVRQGSDLRVTRLSSSHPRGPGPDAEKIRERVEADLQADRLQEPVAYVSFVREIHPGLDKDKALKMAQRAIRAAQVRATRNK